MSRKILFVFVVAVLGAGGISPVFSQTKEGAEKWLKNAKDTYALVVQTAKELTEKGIEEKAKQDPAIKSEWDSAKNWLSMAEKEIKKAEELCGKKKWRECENTANWAWQLLVKAATAALNAGRSAGLK